MIDCAKSRHERSDAADACHLVSCHVARYPKMLLADVYKLLHQRCLGNEHAVTNADHARRWLVRELDQLREGPAEPLIDAISADGQLVRIHLRPFVRESRDVDVLVNAFVRTASLVDGSIEALERALSVVATATSQGALPFDTDEARAVSTGMAAAGFPAAHHSDVYRTAYRPAYRVVDRRFLPDAWLGSRETA